MTALSKRFYRPDRQHSHVCPPMDVGAYMVLLFPAQNVVWHNARRFADVRFNSED